MLIFRIALLAATSTAFSYTSSTISKSGISSSKSSLSSTVERSQSLPFLNRPLLLDGSMAGDVGFDPLGLSTIDDLSIDLYWLREAEIKHARVAMLAVAGILQVEVFGPAPGCEMATTKCQTDAFWELWNAHPQYIAAGLIGIFVIEWISGIATTRGKEIGREPGDFGLDPLGYGKGDPAAFKRLQKQEIMNGRLAMWAASGLLLQGTSNHLGGIEALMKSLTDNAF